MVKGLILARLQISKETGLDRNLSPQKKKALIVTSIWGFLAKFEEEDVKILQRLGYEVHYASNKANPIYQFPEDVYEKMGIIYHDLPIWQSPYGIKPNVASVKQVREIIRRERITLVHCHTPTGGMVARLAARGTDAEVIYTVHGFHFYQGGGTLHNLMFHIIEDFLGRFTDTIITINREDYAAAQKLHHRGDTYQIPGTGLDRDRFFLPDEKQRKHAKERLHISDDTFLLLQVGEIRENKNQETILKAIDQLRNNGTDIRNILYGVVGAGKQEGDLRRLSEELALGSNVVFYGYQEDVRPYLMAADVTVAPSFREGFGMAAAESLSMGVPVIAADNRGTREYMQDGINGYVCWSNQPAEYAVLLERMIREKDQWIGDKERRQKIRETTCAFDKDKKTKIMRQIYRKQEIQ